uniref:Uncharacterized protein n=1 Tax=Anguilla anguilla TaxID=7936 RepID=A0A0E9TH99_ANGAN
MQECSQLNCQSSLLDDTLLSFNTAILRSSQIFSPCLHQVLFNI